MRGPQLFPVFRRRQAAMREELFGGKTVWNVARKADREMFRRRMRGLLGDSVPE